MFPRLRYTLWLGLLLVIGLALSGCGNKGPLVPAPAPDAPPAGTP